MINWFINAPSYVQALIASLFTFLFTTLGSAVVFLFKNVKKDIMDAMLGLSSGVMISASFFSLINPALDGAKDLGLIPWVIVSIGVLMGGLLLFVGDKIFDRLNNNTTLKRNTMLVFSITLHNIPEGMSIGVAFGSVLFGLNGATLASALLLALGIGIQNFPEGSSISLPLKRDGYSSKKAFIVGSLSGIVEPISAILGAVLVSRVVLLLPVLLSFAGGAMIYVVVQELIPESQSNDKKDLMALFTIIGFIIMMIFDVALG